MMSSYVSIDTVKYYVGDAKRDVHPETPYILLESLSRKGVARLIRLTWAFLLFSVRLSYIYSNGGLENVVVVDHYGNVTQRTNCSTWFPSANLSTFSSEMQGFKPLDSLSSYSVSLIGTNDTRILSQRVFYNIV